MKAFPSLLLAGGIFLVASLHAEPTGTAKRLVEYFHMQRIPQEGPWFSVTYVSTDPLPGPALPARYAGKAHDAGSAINLVLTRDDFSALHKLRTDETWHFYGGDPIEMLLLYPDGHGDTVVIGPDVFAGQHPQFTVPRGVWQGSAPRGPGPEAYSFAGDQLAPAFDYTDFEPGYRDELQKAYPPFADQIARLTRAEFATRPPASNADPGPAATPAGPVVFTQAAVDEFVTGPGIHLRELVGRAGRAKSDAYSVAAFHLDKAAAMPVSRNVVSEETLLVTAGHGEVNLGTSVQPVSAGTVITVPPGAIHSIRAAAHDSLDFYAVEAPAFRPDDYVVEPAAR